VFALALPASLLGLASTMLAAPQPALERVETVVATTTEISRAKDGLFYVTAMVNGAPVRFLVDTGASVVVLTPEDARRAGLSLAPAAFTGLASTANGKTTMARVSLNEVIVAGTRIEAIDAAVVEQGLHVSLLGQSMLSRLNSVTIRADSMVLN